MGRQAPVVEAEPDEPVRLRVVDAVRVHFVSHRVASREIRAADETGGAGFVTAAAEFFNFLCKRTKKKDLLESLCTWATQPEGHCEPN